MAYAYMCGNKVRLSIGNDDLTLTLDDGLTLALDGNDGNKVVGISNEHDEHTVGECKEVNVEIKRLYYTKVAPPRVYDIVYQIKFFTGIINGVVVIVQRYDGTTASSISYSILNSKLF